MPIEELTNEEVLQRCSVCQKTSKVGLATLSVGIGSSVQDDIDARVLRLPPCSACASEEFLIRSVDGQPMPPSGSYAHLHHLLVDQLHALLVKGGRVDKRLAKLKVAELTAEQKKELFPNGLKLPPPAAEKLETPK